MGVIIKSTFFTLCFLAQHVMFGQCLQIPVSLDYIQDHSSLIVEGQIISKHSFWNDEQTMIYTSYDLKIYKVLQGEIDSNRLTLLTQGGEVGERKVVVNPELSFVGDEIGIFFLNPSNMEYHKTKYYKAWAIDQSYYHYDYIERKAVGAFAEYSLDRNELINLIQVKNGINPKIVSDFDVKQWMGNKEIGGTRAITSFTPSTITAGTNSVLTINGNGFGSAQGTVYFFNASTNSSYSSADPSQIVSWSNTQIKVRVPSFAGTGLVLVVTSTNTQFQSATNLNIPYSVSSFPNATADKFVRYVSTTTQGKITVQLNNTFNSNTAAKESFLRALKSWNCATDINWVVGTSTSINSNSADGISVIRWANTGEITYPIIGQYSGFFFACSNPSTEWYAEEFDIRFLPSGNGVNWEFGPSLPASNETDFESVALHELGHAMILGHINDVGKVMHRYIVDGTSQRSVDTPALDGALFSMPLHLSGGINCSNYYPLTLLPSVQVTNSNSSGAGSLVQAIQDVCPNHDITFGNSLIGATIPITGSEISINKNLNLVGLGMNNLTLSGQNARRIFNIAQGATVTIQDIKLSNGYSTSNGGAFYNNGHLTLKNVNFVNNHESTFNKAFTLAPNSDLIINNSVVIKP